MSELGIGDYLSGMRHHSEVLLSRMEDFWRQIHEKAKESRAYKGHIIVTAPPEYLISLTGVKLTCKARSRIVFLATTPLLEVDIYKEVKEDTISVMKVYFDTGNNIFLGHPNEVEPIDFFYSETDTPFFDSFIKAASSGGFISIDQKPPARTPS